MEYTNQKMALTLCPMANGFWYHRKYAFFCLSNFSCYPENSFYNLFNTVTAFCISLLFCLSFQNENWNFCFFTYRLSLSASCRHSLANKLRKILKKWKLKFLFWKFLKLGKCCNVIIFGKSYGIRSRISNATIQSNKMI